MCFHILYFIFHENDFYSGELFFDCFFMILKPNSIHNHFRNLICQFNEIIKEFLNTQGLKQYAMLLLCSENSAMIFFIDILLHSTIFAT